MVRDGVGWRLLRPVWVKTTVVCIFALLAAMAVYYLYTWYPELNYWVHETNDKEVDYWHNELTNQYLDYDLGHPALRTMQWRLCCSHVTAIALALLVFFRLERLRDKTRDAIPAVRVAVGLAVYFLVLGFLMFNAYAIAVVPYLMLIYLICCTDYFERNLSEWFKEKTTIWWFFCTSAVSLLILSYFLSSLNEELSVFVAFAYMVIVLIALLVGLIAGFGFKRSGKSFLSGVVWGFSFALIMLSTLVDFVIVLLVVSVGVNA